MSTSADPATRLCVRCGYDLRALPSARCPECGLPFDPDTPLPPVPWVQHREIGLLRAYVRTVALVVLRPKEFARQAWRRTAMNPRDAELFRRLTVLIAAFSMGSVWTSVGLIDDYNVRNPLLVGSHFILGFEVFACVMTFLAISTLPVPIAFPLAQDDFEQRFAALQKYSCAGLSLAAVTCFIGILTEAIGRFDDDGWLMGIIQLIGLLAFIGSALAVFLAWFVGCAAYLAFAGHVDGKTWTVAIAKTAVLWAMAIGATLAVSAGLRVILGPTGL